MQGAKAKQVARWLGVIILVSTVAACAASNPPGNPFAAGEAGRPREPVFLTVDNQDFRDATVYANWNGIRTRVGSVTGKTSDTFRMTWRDYQVRFEVDFLGGGAFRTDQISVQGGDHVDLVIPPGW